MNLANHLPCSRVLSSQTPGVQDRGGGVVRAGALVPRGCVLGPDTVVGKGVHLPEFTRCPYIVCRVALTAVTVTVTRVEKSNARSFQRRRPFFMWR